ncbi:LLM class flavin-dependent oxidoreductase [Streptomyces sp. MC1]|uniref:LLM class flavin-dependent oxidoreductase n=1 Tax=Streptomyces sp. MC1 TaxID=295105 RepID=UPI0018C9FA65|nr:LLM class flavin-dependent oxidoreductase [Streptomyces sp. MC1]MBG7700349.1 LLM class flavin-dependent oxidoreductase [Streptomyces sp. MC1]
MEDTATPGGTRTGTPPAASTTAVADTAVAAAGPHGSAPAPLSVLDLSVVGEGDSAAEALAHTVALAQEAERRGYRRFWVAEHHSFPASASPAPAVLLAHLAGVTSGIRLGSGGVMLTNHAPLVVAEQFGVLNALHPGRIDLGLGRNPGGLPSVAQALRRGDEDPGPDGFREQLDEVLGFLKTEFPEDHPYTRDHVHVVPGAPGLPVWVLGSGTTGAMVAARLGLPFVAAYHINAAQVPKAVETYREEFRPSKTLHAPYLMVSANVVCAESEPEALSLARSGALMLALARQGRQTRLPSAQTAAEHPYTAEERRITDLLLSTVVHGTPEAVRAGLTDLQRRTGADELMLTSMIHDFPARKLSYSLVAEEFALSGDARVTPAPM